VWLEMPADESPLAMFSKSCFTKQIVASPVLKNPGKREETLV